MKFRLIPLLSTLSSHDRCVMVYQMNKDLFDAPPRNKIWVHYKTSWEVKGEKLITNMHFSHFSIDNKVITT